MVEQMLWRLLMATATVTSQRPTHRLVKHGRLQTGEGYGVTCPHCRAYYLFRATAKGGERVCEECGQTFVWARPVVLKATTCECEHSRRQHEPRGGVCRECDCSLFR